MGSAWKNTISIALGIGVLALGASAAKAQEVCPRGQLDNIYCDRDGDMVADTPADPSKLKDPSTLIWAYTPVEDPAIYVNMLKPFVDHLTACTGKRTVHYAVQSNAAQIEAMRSGRLHIAGFSTGPTAFAVNLAGAVPFAAGGSESGTARLQSDRDREGGQPLQVACRPQGQEGRAHIAVVKLGQSRAARVVSAARA